MTWSSSSLRTEIVDIFIDAQAPMLSQIVATITDQREHRLQDGRDYYRFVRTAPAWREKENAAARQKRRAARRERAAARPPCPHCGAAVTRGAEVPRGRKLPTYCSPRCTRAAIWKRWYARNRKRAST